MFVRKKVVENTSTIYLQQKERKKIPTLIPLLLLLLAVVQVSQIVTWALMYTVTANRFKKNVHIIGQRVFVFWSALVLHNSLNCVVGHDFDCLSA